METTTETSAGQTGTGSTQTGSTLLSQTNTAETTNASVLTTQETATPPDFLSSSPKDWKLPEDLQGYKSFEKYPTAAELLRSYKSMESTLSSRQALKPPGEGAKPEEIAAWRKTVGAPEKPGDYGLTKPEKLPDGVEWNDGLAKSLAEVAHKHHAPPALVKDLVALHMQNLEGITKNAQSANDAETAQAREALRKEWGDEFSAKAKDAATIMKSHGLDPEDPKYGNDPALARAFASLAGTFKSSGALVQGSPSLSVTAESRLAELSKSDDFHGKNGEAKQFAALNEIQRMHNIIKGAK